MSKAQPYLDVEEVVDNKFYKAQKKKVKKEQCVHKFFTCRCAICNKVLGSESNLDFLKANK